MTAVKAAAPAKINLTLHITGQRADGYHLLDSLVCFAHVGDVVTAARADTTQVTVSGPFAAGVPTGPDNLVARAADLLSVAADIHIEKNLPVASGIGGGSADAAAAVQALTSLYNIPVPSPDTLLSLGADVPVCALGDVVRMRGIGEQLDLISGTPLSWPMVLVNPGVAVSTADIFARLTDKTNPPMSEPLEDIQSDAFPDWLATQRNDLETAAIVCAPVIGTVLSTLRAYDGCRIARMSGSGATCFALFDTDEQASAAVEAITTAQPNWWAVVAIS